MTANLTLRLLYPQEENPDTYLIGGRVGCTASVDSLEEGGRERALVPLPRIRPWIILPTAKSLYWLHYPGSQYNYLGQKV